MDDSNGYVRRGEFDATVKAQEKLSLTISERLDRIERKVDKLIKPPGWMWGIIATLFASMLATIAICA